MTDDVDIRLRPFILKSDLDREWTVTGRFATLPVRYLDASLPGRLATWTVRHRTTKTSKHKLYAF